MSPPAQHRATVAQPGTAQAWNYQKSTMELVPARVSPFKCETVKSSFADRRGRGVFIFHSMEENPDIEIAHQKGYNVTCCRSYRSPKGRCYSCPEEEFNTEKDIDEEEF